MAFLRGDLDTTYSPFIDSMKRDSQNFTSTQKSNLAWRLGVTQGQDENDSNNQSRTVHTEGEQQAHEAKQDREHQASSSYQIRNEGTLQQNNNGHGDIEDNPWNVDIFQDIILEEIIVENNEETESNHKEFDHTWNLDAENDRMNAEDPTLSALVSEADSSYPDQNREIFLNLKISTYD
ncbi:hypothetical protein ACQ4PT_059205 [Festuca glaucescens]